MKLIAAVLLAILGFAARPVSAQVVHVAAIDSSVFSSIVGSSDLAVPLSQAPVEWNAPDYTGVSVEYLNYGDGFFRSTQFGQYSRFMGWQAPMELQDGTARGAASGQGTRGTYLYFTAFNKLFTWDPNSQVVLRSPPLSILTGTITSLAMNKREDVLSGFADGRASTLTLISQGQLFLADPVTGSTTLLVTLGSATDVFYHSYGPNGLLYVLDYGNNRVLVLDPANAYAQTTFPLQAGVTTANQQFGIGSTGNIYFSDGLGGGTTYSQTGIFLNSFHPPADTPTRPLAFPSYVTAQFDGYIYSYDFADGFVHQYLDQSVPLKLAVPDTIGPTANPIQSPDPNGAGWNNTDVTVTWQWADNVGGAGIDFLQCPATTSSTGEGTVTVSASCKDRAGNSGSGSYIVKVDKTLPAVSFTSPVAGNTYPTTSSVTITWTATDAGSGVATQAGMLDGAVPVTNGQAVNLLAGFHTLGVTVTDNAGNVNTAVSTFSMAAPGPFTPEVIHVLTRVPIPQATIGLGLSEAPAEANYSAGLPIETFIDDGEYFDALNFPVYGQPIQYPAGLKLDSSSRVAVAGQGTNRRVQFFTGSRGAVYSFDTSTQLVMVDPPPRINVQVVASIAALRIPAALGGVAGGPDDRLAIIADGILSRLDVVTGAMTNVLTLGTASQATYQCFGPNGLLYILDYGNNRVLVLDPANNYAQTSFALQPGVTTANQQFAIGVNGNVYLADGLGGGATYSAAGVFLNTFHPPSVPFYASPKGLSYVSAQPDGHIYVYDLHLGYIHQYLDQSVVDSLAPVARPSQFPAANSAGWNNSDVTVSWNWTDNGGTGMDAAHCSTGSVSSGEGALTLNANCNDLAGNTGSGSYIVNVDKTAPAVSITSPLAGHAYAVATPVTLVWSATDAGSGIATQSGILDGSVSVTNGQVVTLASGSHTLVVNATDIAGNVSSRSSAFTVSAANLVVRGALTRGGGIVSVVLTISNVGGTGALNVVVTAGKVGTAAGTPLPQNVGTIAAGASAQVTVTVPGSTGASGASSSLAVNGTYTGGSFSSSARIVLP